MKSKEITGNWVKTKGKLKQKFALLTDNDSLLEEGRNEELFGRLQIRLNKSKEELLRIIETL